MDSEQSEACFQFYADGSAVENVLSMKPRDLSWDSYGQDESSQNSDLPYFK
jgi:hypothetical protein